MGLFQFTGCNPTCLGMMLPTVGWTAYVSQAPTDMFAGQSGLADSSIEASLSIDSRLTQLSVKAYRVSALIFTSVFNAISVDMVW